MAALDDALEFVRPALHADRGDLMFHVSTRRGIVGVELLGACGTCPLSIVTLVAGIEGLVLQRSGRRQRYRPLSGTTAWWAHPLHLTAGRHPWRLIRTMGIWRAALSWYSANLCVGSTSLGHTSARSTEPSVVAVASKKSALCRTQTLGSAAMFTYQEGWSSAPPFDATMSTASPSRMWVRGTRRIFPVLLPLV